MKEFIKLDLTAKKADMEYILVSDAKAGSTNTLLLHKHTDTHEWMLY